MNLYYKFILCVSLVVSPTLMAQNSSTTKEKGKIIVSGKASLIKLSDEKFEIVKSDGTSKIINTNFDWSKKAQIPGILAVLFNDCNEIRDEINDYTVFDEGNLKILTSSYNNCSYESYMPSEKEVRQSNNFSEDAFGFYVGAGASVNRISFFNFDDYETLTQPEILVGIQATPGFTGSVQGNLYFTAALSAAISSDKEFDNAPFETNFSKNSFRFTLGTEYRFLKEQNIQPFIGIGIGAAVESFDGTYNGDPINQSEANIFFQPKAGILFNTGNGKQIGFNISFIPEYESNLSFRKNGQVVPLIIDSHYFGGGLTYHF